MEIADFSLITHQMQEGAFFSSISNDSCSIIKTVGMAMKLDHIRPHANRNPVAARYAENAFFAKLDRWSGRPSGPARLGSRVPTSENGNDQMHETGKNDNCTFHQSPGCRMLGSESRYSNTNAGLRGSRA